MTELDRLRQHVSEGWPITLQCSGVHSESRRRCLVAAQRLLITGCVHEHVGPTFVCAGHDAAADMECHECHVAGHQCPLAEIDAPSADVDSWLFERLTPADPTGVDMDEWHAFVRDNLHKIVPVRLRTVL
ncbi:hypothetical protein ACIBHX_01865 [Nonomuraea sp. NPDC050536]|uniref:hypothetical protein n=1 Tax=Nonomuraea sp. NPDC050536 TaxID=3364366 RepID=UPI0037CB120A